MRQLNRTRKRRCNPVAKTRLMGRPGCGTGKRHLAQALGHCAVRQGVNVVFATCVSLTQSLNAARATGAYERKLASLAKVPLLIIDDFGLMKIELKGDFHLQVGMEKEDARYQTLVQLHKRRKQVIRLHKRGIKVM